MSHLFTENFKYPGRGGQIRFSGASFNSWVHASLPEIAIAGGHHDPKLIGDSKTFYTRVLPKDALLEIYRGSDAAYVSFDSDVEVPILGNKYGVWMSLTPNEVLTQRKHIRRTRGDVGIAGLGLGWAARRILQRPKVKKLTVYDSDRDLIRFFRKSLFKEFGSRVRVLHANAYDVNWNKHDVAYWDIWEGLGDAADDNAFMEIKGQMETAGKVCVGWGDNV